MKNGGAVIYGKVWIPEDKLEIVKKTLDDISRNSKNHASAVLKDIQERNNYDKENKSKSPPPTYIKSNEFV